MSDRPTDKAIEAFGRATNTALLAATTKDPVKLAHAVNSLSGGLIHLATGLRATYILLDEVKGLLQRQQSGTASAAGAAVGARDHGSPNIIVNDPAIRAMIKDAVRNAGK